MFILFQIWKLTIFIITTTAATATSITKKTSRKNILTINCARHPDTVSVSFVYRWIFQDLLTSIYLLHVYSYTCILLWDHVVQLNAGWLNNTYKYLNNSSNDNIRAWFCDVSTYVFQVCSCHCRWLHYYHICSPLVLNLLNKIWRYFGICVPYWFIKLN